MVSFLLFGIDSLVVWSSAWLGALAYCNGARNCYNADEGSEVLTGEPLHGTRGSGHDARPDELTTSQRGRHGSRIPRGGHHDISFRYAR